MTATTFTLTVTSASAPSWASGQINQWVTLGAASRLDSVLAGSAGQGIMEYCGGCLDPASNIYYLIGGGHSTYHGNDCYAIDLKDEVPSWSRVGAESTPIGLATVNQSYYADGRPTSRHTWNGTEVFAPTIGASGSILLLGANSAYGSGNYSTSVVDAFDLATGDYNYFDGTHWIAPEAIRAAGPNPYLPSIPSQAGANYGVSMGSGAWVLGRDNQGGNTGYHFFNYATKSWVTPGTAPPYANARYALIYDSLRGVVVTLPTVMSQTPKWYDTFSASDGSNFARSAWPHGDPALLWGSGFGVYDAANDRYLLMAGNNAANNLVWAIDPETMDYSQVTTQNPLTYRAGAGHEQPHGRFAYVSFPGTSVAGVLFMNWTDFEVAFMRVA